MKMIEKIADAILAESAAGMRGEMLKTDALSYARAALRALREPTDEMIAAAQREDIMLEEEVWGAMIVAAIAEAT